MTQWINKQRTLIVSTRGITNEQRHLLNDLHSLLPHSIKEAKLEKQNAIEELRDLAEVRGCSHFIFFENKKRKFLRIILGNVLNGPSVMFDVDDITTTDELKLTGNCLKGSRPILIFDKEFSNDAPLQLIKELMINTLGTPKMHPKSMPFIDHVFFFGIEDNRIWFRNYEILYPLDKKQNIKLLEIGQRFCLLPLIIFNGFFGGDILWKNHIQSNLKVIVQ